MALGLAAMLAASRLIPVGDTEVVVTHRDVTAGQPLTARDVTVAHYPKSLVPADGFTDPDDVVGALPRTDFTTGTPVTAAMLRPAASVPSRASSVAFPLHVADAEAVKLLHPGDHIMVFRRAPDTGAAEVAADDVVVLSIRHSHAAALSGSETGALITVDVGKHTARLLAGTDSAYTFALLGG